MMDILIQSIMGNSRGHNTDFALAGTIIGIMAVPGIAQSRFADAHDSVVKSLDQ